MRATRLVIVAIAAIAVLLPCGGCAPARLPQGQVATVPAMTGGTPDNDVTWINPAVVSIGNYNAGDTATYNIEIHNGAAVPNTFDVTYRVPDRVHDGYDFADARYSKYVTIAPAQLTLGAFGTGSVAVVVMMASDEVPPSYMWEFWVSVISQGDTGLIRKELCSRWQVAMPHED